MDMADSRMEYPLSRHLGRILEGRPLRSDSRSAVPQTLRAGRGGQSQAEKGFSIRWHPSTLDEAHARSEKAGIAFNVLTERYVIEGLRMDQHPLIYFRGGAAGRRPTLMGTRLDVAPVISTIRQNDNSVQEAAEYLRLPASHVEASVKYYLDYQDEIDAWIEQDEEEAAAAENSWRKRPTGR